MESPTAEIPREIYAVISVTYTDKGCVIWWKGRDAWLNGASPKACWDAGFESLVYAAAQRLEGGF